MARAVLLLVALAMVAVLGQPASAAPGPPSVTGTSPTSPANDNLPLVKGSADPGSTVRLYTNSTCTSPVVASGSAAQFAFPGIAAGVADNSTTTFWANATDGTGTSPCSTTSLRYQEVSPVSPPGKVAFISPLDGNWEIFSMNADGTNQTQLTFDGPAPQASLDPGASPDGTKIAWSRDLSTFTRSDIWVMNADGTGKIQLTSNTTNEDYPDWSPDGTKIAFTRGLAPEIWKMNADGTGQTRVSPVAANDNHPDWSPDGTKIAFTTSAGGSQFDVFVMNADGTGRVNLTNNAATDEYPAWSPDGSKLAFSTNRDGNYEIYTVNADGTGLTRLTNTGSLSEFNPAWNPTGRIVFDRGGAGVNQDVWVMNPDGTAQTQLTTDASNDAAPDWLGSGPDTTAPAPPSVTSTSPASPANDNAPLVQGTAQAGSTVRLYTNATCTSAVANNGTSATFASPGISVNAADNTTTTYWATATDAGNNTSACSPTSISYVEDSAPPAAPAITSAPAPDPGTSKTPSWGFTGEPGATFQCELRRGAAIVSAFAPCTSLKSYDLTAQAYGTYTFAVRQTDAAGNGPGPEATESYRLVAAGGKIVYSSQVPGNLEIYTMDPDGSNQTRLTFSAGRDDSTPTWSPDGSKIYWSGYDIGPGTYNLWAMNADGTGQTQLTSDAVNELAPEVSPDGTKLVFQSYGCPCQVYVSNVSGTGRAQLTTSNSNRLPEWSPDGTRSPLPATATRARTRSTS